MHTYTHAYTHTHTGVYVCVCVGMPECVRVHVYTINICIYKILHLIFA